MNARQQHEFPRWKPVAMMLGTMMFCCAALAHADGSRSNQADALRPTVKPGAPPVTQEGVAERKDAAPAAPPPQRLNYASLIVARAPVLPPAPAEGGGVGKVWVNTMTHVYYCPGDTWYGRTRDGQYMSVADAKAAHAHPHRGKRCT